MKSKGSRPSESALASLRDHFSSRADAMLATIRELVEMESPSGDKAAVDRLGKVLGEKFTALGGRVKFHPGGKFGDHVQADFDGAAGKPILLLGHYDTVWSVGTLTTMPFTVKGSKAFGPGIFDMKTGIAMMMEAVAALRQLRGGLPRPVTVLLNADEEVGSESSRAVTERLARGCEAVLVLEPASEPVGKVKTSRKGVGDYTVKVTGVPSHAGLDFDKGHSAIVELARQIIIMTKFTDPKRGITVNPGVIRGGTRTNVVAAEAEVDVDIRIAHMADAKILERKFRGLRAVDRKCKLEVTGGLNRPPLERNAGVAKLYALARDLAAGLNWKLGEIAVGGGSDGNFTAGLGIPTLDGLGGAGDGAHAHHEHILIDALPRKTALVAGLIERI